MKQYIVTWELENGKYRKSNDTWDYSDIDFLEKHFGLDLHPAFTKDGSLFIANYKSGGFSDSDIIKVVKFSTFLLP